MRVSVQRVCVAIEVCKYVCVFIKSVSQMCVCRVCACVCRVCLRPPRRIYIYMCDPACVCTSKCVCVCVCVAVCVTSHSHLHIEHSVLSRLVDFSSEIAPLFIAFHAAVNT